VNSPLFEKVMNLLSHYMQSPRKSIPMAYILLVFLQAVSQMCENHTRPVHAPLCAAGQKLLF
jgi:hypothetical protein